MAKKKQPEPNDTELPLNNDEAAAISNLLESVEKARELGETRIAEMCIREADYILRRGRPNPGELIHLVQRSNPTPQGGAAPGTPTSPECPPPAPSQRSPSLRLAPSTPAPDAPQESGPPKTTGP